MDCIDSPVDADSKAQSQTGDRYGGSMGILLSWHGAILDYDCTSDGMDGCALVDKLLDCDINLVADYGMGRGIVGLMGGGDVAINPEVKYN